ncbi:MAG: hypothetical protein LW808_003235 [Verrucomicrobiota bacterium]|nr:MAG: hypothetical protein LW808_003235 [Verrucomicrobiota bacterium]
MNETHFFGRCLQFLCICAPCALYGVENPENQLQTETNTVVVHEAKSDSQIDAQAVKILPQPEALPAEHKALVSEMSQMLSGPTEQAKKELVDANILPDAQKPSNFQATSRIDIERVKFDTSRLMIAMKKWGQVRIDLKPQALVKGQEWADNCKIRLYVGFNGCLPSGRMLLMRSECTCICLKNNELASVYFFIPGDVRKRYSLARQPDYCALRLIVDGHTQDIVITDKDGKNSHAPNAEKLHKETKEKAQIEVAWMRNIDQLPINADVKVKHPAMRLEI